MSEATKYKAVVLLFDLVCVTTGLAAGGWMLSILINLQQGMA